MGGLIVAASFRLEINIPGFREARRDPAIIADLERRGRAIAAAAGQPGDFSVTTFTNGDRARVIVAAETVRAKRAEAKYRVLTSAMDAGRG